MPACSTAFTLTPAEGEAEYLAWREQQDATLAQCGSLGLDDPPLASVFTGCALHGSRFLCCRPDELPVECEAGSFRPTGSDASRLEALEEITLPAWAGQPVEGGSAQTVRPFDVVARALDRPAFGDQLTDPFRHGWNVERTLKIGPRDTLPRQASEQPLALRSNGVAALHLPRRQGEPGRLRATCSPELRT